MRLQLIFRSFARFRIILGLVIVATVLLEACSQSVVPSLRATAEQGDANAQYNLGLLYLSGDGVPEDYPQAAEWIRAAAELGLAEAQAHLGVLYAMGQGVRQDNEEAYAWIRTALSQGYEDGPEFLLESLVELMTPSQLERGEELAREYLVKYVMH